MWPRIDFFESRGGCGVRWGGLAVMLVLLSGVAAGGEVVLWEEDWEGNWFIDWHVDGGTWEVGSPTRGPDSAYADMSCAATVLGGNYAEGVESMLIRHLPFVVPDATDNPRLRFWHWHSFSCADNGTVQIKVGDDPWEIISPTYVWTGSDVWSRALIDLSGYAGSTVQIGFSFHSQNSGSCNGSGVDVSSGWYIDEVKLVTGELDYESPDGFELGLADWAAEAGTWEVGEPTSGPGVAYEGLNCAATVLAGNYHESVDSRLVSPPLEVPDAGEMPRLRFWHWYSFSCSDNGRVDIRIDDGPWETVSTIWTNTGSRAWTKPLIDLTPFAGSTIQIGFYFHSRNSGSCNGSGVDVSSGWYIDQVEIATGPMPFLNPQGFESGIGDWAADRGTWEVGEPTFGPVGAFGGSGCAGTVLAANYEEAVDSRLISPPLLVPPLSELPRLRFWQWYSFSCSDNGRVEIRVDDGEWETVSAIYTSTGSGVWTRPSIDLTDHAGSTIQIGFSFHSQNSGSCNGSGVDVSSGWYLDDVEVVTGPITFSSPEDFEAGPGDWASERGTWEIGEPTSGPSGAHGGASCAATVLAGNYDEAVDSRLISPLELLVTSDAPSLVFWHWFNFNCSDYGEVQISVNEGPWQVASPPFVGSSSGVWSPYFIDFSALVDSTVQVAFFFHSHNDAGCNGSGSDVSTGWYVDDVLWTGLVDVDLPLSAVIPNGLRLHQNRPNPFTPFTSIPYEIGVGGRTQLQIYNVAGQRVRTLVDQSLEPGRYAIQWDGRSDAGLLVPSGAYFYRLSGLGEAQTRKMLLLK